MHIHYEQDDETSQRISHKTGQILIWYFIKETWNRPYSSVSIHSDSRVYSNDLKERNYINHYWPFNKQKLKYNKLSQAQYPWEAASTPGTRLTKKGRRMTETCVVKDELHKAASQTRDEVGAP